MYTIVNTIHCIPLRMCCTNVYILKHTVDVNDVTKDVAVHNSTRVELYLIVYHDRRSEGTQTQFNHTDIAVRRGVYVYGHINWPQYTVQRCNSQTVDV